MTTDTEESAIRANDPSRWWCFIGLVWLTSIVGVLALSLITSVLPDSPGLTVVWALSWVLFGLSGIPSGLYMSFTGRVPLSASVVAQLHRIASR